MEYEALLEMCRSLERRIAWLEKIHEGLEDNEEEESDERMVEGEY